MAAGPAGGSSWVPVLAVTAVLGMAQGNLAMLSLDPRAEPGYTSTMAVMADRRWDRGPMCGARRGTTAG